MREGCSPGSASSGLASSGAVLSGFSLARSDLCAPVIVCRVTGVASWLETYGEVTAILSLMTGVRLDVGKATIERGEKMIQRNVRYEVLR